MSGLSNNVVDPRIWGDLIKWSGDQCPVGLGEAVLVYWSDGLVEERAAETVKWETVGQTTFVVSYRRLKRNIEISEPKGGGAQGNHSLSRDEIKRLKDEANDGPWFIKNEESPVHRGTIFFQEIWDEGYNVLIATEVTRAHLDGGKANMRLIRAAPEIAQAALDAMEERDALLEALSWYANLTSDLVVRTNTGLEYGDLELLGERARVAIEKVRK